MARATITKKSAAKSTVAPAVVMAAAWEKFPTRSDFGLEPITLPVFQLPKAGNAAGVARSWGDSTVRAARITKHGVVVTHNGEMHTFKSVAEAFRSLRLPMEKHIKFRLGLKAAGQSVFEAGGKMYAFSLVTGVSA